MREIDPFEPLSFSPGWTAPAPDKRELICFSEEVTSLHKKFSRIFEKDDWTVGCIDCNPTESDLQFLQKLNDLVPQPNLYINTRLCTLRQVDGLFHVEGFMRAFDLQKSWYLPFMAAEVEDWSTEARECPLCGAGPYDDDDDEETHCRYDGSELYRPPPVRSKGLQTIGPLPAFITESPSLFSFYERFKRENIVLEPALTSSLDLEKLLKGAKRVLEYKYFGLL